MTVSTGCPSRSPSMARRFAASLLAPALLLWLAGGCSSTAIQTDDGAAGATGNGGSPGGGAGGSADAGDTCAALTAAYSVAFQNAVSCNPLPNVVQCVQLASPSLLCPICMQFVNDTTVLDQIRAQAATQCPAVPCPAIACKEPAGGVCMPADGGGALGTCVSRL